MTRQRARGASVTTLVVGLAVAAVIAGVVIGLRVHEASLERERTAHAVDRTRDEARQLLGYCLNKPGVAGQLGMATAKFGMYIATHDHANMLRVMNDLVAQSVSAFDMACASAQGDIAFIQKNVVEPDSWIDAKADEVADMRAYLERVQKAADELRLAIEASPDDLIVQKLAALGEAAKPPPAPQSPEPSALVPAP